MKCQSTRFGTFEVNDDVVVGVPSGILGFHWTKYVMLDQRWDAPFKWLQCRGTTARLVILDPAPSSPIDRSRSRRTP